MALWPSDYRFPVMTTTFTWWCFWVLTCTGVPKCGNAVRSFIHPGQRFQECGGVFNASRGYFHTPNFPAPFPVPISCRWVIEAPRHRTIMLHFTQFYLREGVRAKAYTDYDKFWGRTDVGERDLGAVSADNKTTRLTTTMPYLVIDLELDDLRNTNLRVLDSLMDVYGFNVTYEMVDVIDDVRRTSGGSDPTTTSSSSLVLREACSAWACSFNGNCLGSADLEHYWCHCFPRFFGDRCQFGPDCDLDRGKNRCLNGGNCSYEVGSRAYYCDCPDDFGGPNCEQRLETFNGKACRSLGCAHLCKRDKSGIFHCACSPGFRLANDNQTCISSGLIRYVGSIKLKNASYVPSLSSNKSSAEYVRLKSNLESKLVSLLGSKVKHLKNVTVLEFRPGAIVEFHFFGVENDSGLAQEALSRARQLGRIDTIPLDSGYISFAQEQAVNIRTLRVEPRDQLVVGQELRVACVSLGSSALKFRWLKDGAEIYINARGGIWEKLLAKNAKDEYTAILGIDRVEEAHAGYYTCKVSDWGPMQSRTVKVSVLSRPQVFVSPLSVTANQGDELSILCMSHVLRSNKFGYRWAKNGVMMGAHDGSEILEDIYPTGSRVKIQNARQSATYSCIVSGMTGETKVDSRVTVIDKSVIKVCPTEDYLGIRWSSSAPNAFDVNPCPIGFNGNVRRRCTYLGHRILVWEEPDFSGCRSLALFQFRTQFDNLRLGFLVTTSSDVLDKIYAYMISRGSDLYPGEAAYVLDFLADVHHFQERNSAVQSLLSNGTDVFFDIMSHLLTSSKAINSELMIIQLIQAAQRRALFLSRNLLIGQLMLIDNEALAVDIIRQPSSGTRNVVVPARRIKRGQSDWTTDSITAKLHFPSGEMHSTADESSVEFAVIVYKNLSKLLPKRFSKMGDFRAKFVDMEYEINSRLVTVAYNSTHPPTDGAESVNLLFNQTLWEVERKGWNVTCGIANLTSGKLEWSFVGCSLVTVENVTSCLCTRFGTYVVLLTTFLTSGSEEFRGRLDYVVAVGCFVGLVWILVTLACLAVCWSNVFQSFIVLKIHICLGFVGVLTTLLVAVHISLPKSAYPYVVALLEFFLLEPLSMHVCLELFLYLELANVQHIQHAITKIVVLGWGIPTIVTGATLVFQTQYGFNLEKWSMQVGDTFFYGFAISSIILLALYVLLYLVVNLELQYKVTKKSPHRNSAKRRMGLLRRSLVLQMAETWLAINCFVYTSNSSSPANQYLFAVACGVTGILVFLLYTINSESPRCSCSKRKHFDSKSSGTSSSSRSNVGSCPLTVIDDQLDCSIAHRATRRKKIPMNHRRCHHRHCTLIGGESREMEDLLHDCSVTTGDRRNCNSLASVSEKENTIGTRESYLEAPTVVDDLPPCIKVAELIRMSGESEAASKLCVRASGMMKRRVVDISIVNYDGSPKKYPSIVKDAVYIEEVEEVEEDDDDETVDDGDRSWPPPPPASMYAIDGPRPEPVRCYIRCSPEVSSLPRESPTSSATSADVSSSSSGVKHAQFCHHNAYQQPHHQHQHQHQVPFCYHWPAFDPQSISSSAVLVPPGVTLNSPDPDVTATARDLVASDAVRNPDERVVPKYAFHEGGDDHIVKHNHLLKVGNSATKLVNLPTIEHRDTVV